MRIIRANDCYHGTFRVFLANRQIGGRVTIRLLGRDGVDMYLIEDYGGVVTLCLVFVYVRR